MRIGVCFKIVPDYETLMPEEWENPERLDVSYVKKMYGCFDESALELALRIADDCKAAGQSVETVAVTAGAPEGSVSEGLLRGLFAAGFDDVVMLPECSGFSPLFTAKSLASYFQAKPAELILTGRMVGPGDSGMVPVYLAEELGYSMLSELTDAQYNSQTKRIEVTCKEENYLKVYDISHPAVCTVGDAEAAYLRLFPLKARMEAKKRVFSQWVPEEDKDEEAVILRSEKKEAETSCSYMEGMTAEEIAKNLIEILDGEAER